MAMSSIFLTFLGLVLSVIAICQTLRARKEIASYHIKTKQVEAMIRLARVLNEQIIEMQVVPLACEVETDYYFVRGNIFEIGKAYEQGMFDIWLDKEISLLCREDTDFQILNVKEFVTNPAIDNQVSDSLSKLSGWGLTSNKCTSTQIEVRLMNNKKEFSNTSIYSGNHFVQVCTREVATFDCLLETIYELCENMRKWCRENKVNDFNLYAGEVSLTKITPSENSVSLND